MVDINGCVRGSRVYGIDGNPAELCLVFAMLIYTLVNAAACATPENTPEGHVLGQVMGVSQADDPAVVTTPSPRSLSLVGSNSNIHSEFLCLKINTFL